ANGDKRPSSHCQNEAARRMGPGLRRDDNGDGYDDRVSSSRRPSAFNNFFTALEAATSPLLA
ncbi:MAG: hypothetical protein QOD11_110, partial [Bradyrhizobium sp.]|nr:hypothetical protein [Bradyrhizobium sp.]